MTITFPTGFFPYVYIPFLTVAICEDSTLNRLARSLAPCTPSSFTGMSKTKASLLVQLLQNGDAV
jgi:hypothetical protein